MKTRRQIFGQHFLHHKPTIKKIIDTVEEAINKYSPKAIFEVGPGKCAITNDLKALSEKYSLPLIVVEKDLKLKDELVEVLGSESLHFFDAASDKILDLIDSMKAQKQTPFIFVSNLPYSAGSQILAQLCERTNELTNAVVMVQKDVAERMVALTEKGKQQNRGSFTVLIDSNFDSNIEFDVGPGAFSPPPKVMSSVVALRPKQSLMHFSAEQKKQFEIFIKKFFSQRRKMIRSLLPEEALIKLHTLDLDGSERPENLSLEQWFNLFKICSNQ